MSDTTEDLPETQPPPPNFAVDNIVVNFNGKEFPARRITFGEPKRSITVRDLGLGDQFDLVEIAGKNAGNSVWMGMAGFAFAITEVDGVPSFSPKNLGHVRAVLDRVKQDGMAAYFYAMNNSDSGANQETIKN